MAITFNPSLNQFRDDYLTKFETAFEPPLRPTKKIVYFVGGPYDLKKEVVGLELKSVEFIVQDYNYTNMYYNSSVEVKTNIARRGSYTLIPVAFSHADNMEIWVGVPQ